MLVSLTVFCRVESGCVFVPVSDAVSVFAGVLRRVSVYRRSDPPHGVNQLSCPIGIAHNPRDNTVLVSEMFGRVVQIDRFGTISVVAHAQEFGLFFKWIIATDTHKQLGDIVCSRDGSYALVANYSFHTIHRIDLTAIPPRSVKDISWDQSLPPKYKPNDKVASPHLSVLIGRFGESGNADGSIETARLNGPMRLAFDRHKSVLYIASADGGIRVFDLITQRLSTLRLGGGGGGGGGENSNPKGFTGYGMCVVSSDRLLVAGHSTLSLYTIDSKTGAEVSVVAGRDQLIAPSTDFHAERVRTAIPRDGFTTRSELFVPTAMAVSTRHEPDERSCVYVCCYARHDLRRIALPAELTVLPDL